MQSNKTENIPITKWGNGVLTQMDDCLAIEEPLEIQLIYTTASGRMQKKIAVTMRTPGNDEELTAGFLFTEGIIKHNLAIKQITQLPSDANSLVVTLIENEIPVLNNAARNFYTTSSCGICGKASLDAITVAAVYPITKDDIKVSAQILHLLPQIVKNEQQVFKHTGGIHASALFTFTGKLEIVREDVGRHNALDKIIGNRFLKSQLPLKDSILFLSGRTSFELVQKAFMAGIKIIVAMGAPSSLAVEMANESGITLIGFLKEDKFNIYTGLERIEF